MTKRQIIAIVALSFSACICTNAQKSDVLPDTPGHTARASEEAADIGAAPLTFAGKARYFGARLVSPWNLITPAFSAAIGMAQADDRLPREWRQGAGAFGRLYGTGLASLESFNTARFISGAAIKEDPRYFRADGGTTGGRLAHALMFTVVDRSDSGRRMPAISNFIGAAAGGTVPNLFIPPPYNQKRYAVSRSAVILAYYAGTNVRREFTPELNRLLKTFHLAH
jgi:hypothetical protein